MMGVDVAASVVREPGQLMGTVPEVGFTGTDDEVDPTGSE